MIKVLLSDFFGVLYDGDKLNFELLEFFSKLKKKCKLAILTSSYHAARDPQIKSELDKVFSDYFFTKDLGLSKKDEACYLLVAEKLKVKPAEILFIDDWSERAAAAARAGCQTIVFENNQSLFSDFSSFSWYNSLL